MSLALDFEICPVDCETFKFIDTTCVHKPYNPYLCVDGYNVPSDINQYDVDSVLFNIIMPDGTILTDIDLGYNVGRKARIEVVMTGYAQGYLDIKIGNNPIVTSPIDVDIETSVLSIVSTINGGANVHGWNAYVKYGTTDTFIIEALDYGLIWNNQQLILDPTVGGITFSLPNGDFSIGANGFTNEYCFGLAEIYGVDCYDGKLDCGVYKFTYRLYDSLSQEITRKTKYVLNVNGIKLAIKNWILLTEKGSCCNEEMDERIFKLRLMLEKAIVQFDSCMYDCSQETIKKAKKYISNLCLDC